MRTNIVSKEINDPMVLAWFDLNKFNSEARNLTFSGVAEVFSWNSKEKKFQRRKRSAPNGRAHYTSRKIERNVALKLLMRLVAGPTSDEELRTYDGVVYQAYEEVCAARGLYNHRDVFE